MQQKIDQATALLEGGQTLRLHTLPHLQHYDVAQHSWGMAALLHALWPQCNKRLLLAVLFHDVGERWVGDTPAPLKWWIEPQVGTLIKQVEARIQKTLDVYFELDCDERYWLKALDITELFLFCCREVRMGNSYAATCRDVCHDILCEPWIPEPLDKWLSTRPGDRTTDALGKE